MGNAAVWAMTAFLHIARASAVIALLLDWIMSSRRRRTTKLPVRSLNSLLESNFSSGAVSGTAVAAPTRLDKQKLMF
jgi:hypothetical protein